MTAGLGYDQLHHFIASGAWDTAPLENALLAETNRMVGADDAWLIFDDTASPKKGEHSVGVARAICLVAWKDRHLSVDGLADLGVARGSGDGGLAAVLAGERDGRWRAHGAGACAGGSANRPDKA